MSAVVNTAVLRDPITFRGRAIVPGIAEAEALVTRQTISGWGGVNPMKGEIIETRHELVGQRFAGKVLLFQGAKGSSGWSAIFHFARLAGTAPAAMLFVDMTAKAALGAVVTHAPTITDFDVDPFTIIATGDRVRVDGDRGIVEVWKR